MESLRNNWKDIQPKIVYVVSLATNDLQVSFSQEQIKLGIKIIRNL